LEPGAEQSLKEYTMLKHSLLLLIVVFLISACDNHSSKNLEVNMDDLDVGELDLSSETMNDIIQNLASSIEVAALINSLNIPYSTNYLSDPESLSTNTTSFEMAYYLGALSADLGYLNIYEKTGTAVNYLSTINRLADALQIGQFFDYATIERLATSGSNSDSLMFISVNSFNNMDNYLRETDRSNLSALMIAGVWVEGLYQATQVAKENRDEELRSMIGEQKLVLNDLLLVLNNYREEVAIVRYINDLEIIKNAYDHVMITYEVGEPQTIKKDSTLTVIQRESSQVTMSEETLKQITQLTEQVRNMHMNIKN
jgi:hypothetical protein